MRGIFISEKGRWVYIHMLVLISEYFLYLFYFFFVYACSGGQASQRDYAEGKGDDLTRLNM